jgi:hypothetical protein
MKIRNGFVSNSSSSSFIIWAEKDFPTVKSVAKYIMKTIIKKYGGVGDFNEEKITLKSMSDPNTPVFFNTGGDETYIRKYEDKIIIVTTQNVDFDKLFDVALKKDDLPDEFYREFDYLDEDGEEIKMNHPGDFDYYYSKFNDFLILEHNIKGRHTYIDNCPYCHSNFSRGWLLKNGKTICKCQINKVKRKQKLIKIDESTKRICE